MANEEYLLIAYLVGVLTALLGLLRLESKLGEWLKMAMIAVGVSVAAVAAFLYET